jgi:hypothetical protein
VRQGSVLSPVLFNAITNEIANIVRIENRRPGIENINICIQCVDLGVGEDEKEIEDKVNQLNLIIKEYTLKIPPTGISTLS